jgi:ribosomal protein S18 acetylase RimI-like enzyme
MTIRIAVRDDLPEMVSLWLELMKYHSHMHPAFELNLNAQRYARQELAMRLREPTTRFFVCDTGKGVLAGMIATHYHYTAPSQRLMWRGYIAETVVRKAFRGQGIGERLVNTAKEWLVAMGVDFIELQVAPANERGVSFWKKQGFEPITYHMAWVVGREGKGKEGRGTGE